MYEYEISYTYIQNGERVRETDTFHGDNAQEAVDTCRAENLYLFAECFGRIEVVWKDGWFPCSNWE